MVGNLVGSLGDGTVVQMVGRRVERKVSSMAAKLVVTLVETKVVQ